MRLLCVPGTLAAFTVSRCAPAPYPAILPLLPMAPATYKLPFPFNVALLLNDPPTRSCAELLFILKVLLPLIVYEPFTLNKPSLRVRISEVTALVITNLPVFISESYVLLLLMLLLLPLKMAIFSFLKVPDIFRSPPTSTLPRLVTVEPLLIPKPWVNFKTPRLVKVELLLTVVPCEKVMVPQALLATV